MASSLFRLARMAAAAVRTQQTLVSRPFSLGTRNSRSTAKTDVRLDLSTIHNANSQDKTFNEAIFKASSMHSILRLLDGRTLSHIQASNVIAALGRLASRPRSSAGTATIEDLESVVSDANFVEACRVVDRQVLTARDLSLLATLQHLYALGVPADQRLMVSIDGEILRRIRKMSLRHLVALLVCHASHQRNELERRVVAEVLEKIQQRWYEIGDAHEILSLLRLSDLFNADFVGRLEDRTMELVPQLSAEELQRLIIALAERRLRPTHLLRALAFHLAKSTQRLSVKHMANVAHATSALNFPDSVLLRRLSDDLVQEVPSVTKSSLVAAFLTAFGQMQWRHTALMVAITEWIEKNASQCRPQDLVAYILTAARVHFIPADAQTFLSKLVTQVPHDSVATKTVWLDLIWSLAVLRCATAEQLASVLDPAFYRELVATPTHQTHNIKRKILGVHAVATVETTDYKGSTDLDNTLFEDCFPINGGTIGSSVLDTLSNFIPKGKFLSGPKVLPCGIPIEGEFIIGIDGKPLAFNEANISGGKLSTKSLPKGARRIALLVHEFKDYTLNDIQLIGSKHVSVRILEKLGYAVVQVSHMEYNLHSPTIKRLQFLQKKIVSPG